jgi:hypothetical protein
LLGVDAHHLSVPSAQIKPAVLLAGLAAQTSGVIRATD